MIFHSFGIFYDSLLCKYIPCPVYRVARVGVISTIVKTRPTVETGDTQEMDHNGASMAAWSKSLVQSASSIS